MELEIQPCENGYAIRTPQCLDFTFGDMEVWSYLGLSDSVAELLAGGFPAHWESSDDAVERGESADELAARHRHAAIRELAKPGVLPEAAGTPTPFKELYDRRQWIADGHFRPFGSTETDYDFYKGTKLEAKFKRIADESREKNRKPLSVSFDEWTTAACKLFDLLQMQSADQLRPGALQVDEKKRLQREGQPARERGTRLVRQSELEHAFACSATNQIQWGPLFYDADVVNDSHFCVFGLGRMGKTTLLRLLFQSVYRTQPDARFVLYDAKADILPYLYPPEYFETQHTQEQIDSEFYNLNPYDGRSTAWDIAADAQNAKDAGEIAAVLFPDVPHRDYFPQAMRAVTAAVMNALTQMANGPHWTFYDLLCALRANNLQSVLETTTHGKETFESYLTGKTFAAEDTYKVLMAKTDAWLPAAHAWLQAKRRLSLRAWVKEDPKSVLLMNHDGDFEAVNEINRIMLGVLFRLLFTKKHDLYRTFFYLDEFENLGRIESILRATKQGASKRINLALCLHDIGLLRKEYGPETEGLLSQCTFMCFLQLLSHETTAWASEVIGTQWKHVPDTTVHLDEEGKPSGKSFAERPQSIPLVVPDEFKQLPSPKVSSQIRGYFVAPSHPRYLGTLSVADLYGDTEGSPLLWPKSELVPEFVERDEALMPPEDKFFSLSQLGFHKPGYTPQIPKPLKASENTTPTQSSPMPGRLTGTKRLKGVIIDFGLDD